MLRIGAHMSVAGGISKAVDRAAAHGCEALQIFTKNANRWLGNPLEPSEVRRFRARLDETAIGPVVSHASYLINLATTFEALRRQSIDAFIDELDRAEALGLLGVVIHPGTCTAGTEEEGLRLIADAIGDSTGRAPRKPDAGTPRAHGGAGADTRLSLRASCGDHRSPGRLPPRGCVPGHLSPGGFRVRHRDRMPVIARRSMPSIDRWASAGSASFTPTTPRSRARAASIGTSTSVAAVSARSRSAALLHDPRFSGLPLLIETEKSPGGARAASIALDPLDVQNLSTLRRLRANA